MSIIAELHDGTEVEFPDDTDPAVIQSTVKRLTLSRQAPPQATINSVTPVNEPGARGALTEMGPSDAAAAVGGLAKRGAEKVAGLVQQPGWGESIAATASDYLGRTGRRIGEASADLNNLPGAAMDLGKSLLREFNPLDLKQDSKLESGAMGTLAGVAAPFNALSAPIEAAAETAAVRGMGMSEEAGKLTGSVFGVGIAGGLGLLTKAGKLNKAGIFINELIGVGSPARDFAAKPGQLQETQQLWKDLSASERRIVSDAAEELKFKDKLAGLVADVEAPKEGADIDLVKTAKPVEAASGPDPSAKVAFDDFTKQTAKKHAQEGKGQSILDELEDTGKTPQMVVREFWDETYDRLPAEVQNRFHGYLKRETGISPGQAVATDRSGQNVIAKTWRDVYPDNVPPEVEHLEGTERGLIALMEEANRRRIKTPQVAPESPLAGTKAPVEGSAPIQPPRRVIDTDMLTVTKFQPERIPQKLEQLPEVTAEARGVASATPTSTDLRPAIRMKDGTVKTGEPGLRHDSVFETIPEKQVGSIRDTGWVDEAGKFMTANEATAAKFAAELPDFAGIAKGKSAMQLAKGGLLLDEIGAVAPGGFSNAQQAMKAQARADRAELYSRISEAASRTGRSMSDVADEMGIARSVLRRAVLAHKVDNVHQILSSVTDSLEGLNERAMAVEPEAERIVTRGTVTPETRVFLREQTGKKPSREQTYRQWISEQAVDQNKIAIDEASKKYNELSRMVEDTGDAITADSAHALRKQLAYAERQLNREADRFKRQRFIVNRTMLAYNRAPFSEDTLRALRRAGEDIEDLVHSKERKPMISNIMESTGKLLAGRSPSALSPSEWLQLKKDIIDVPRLGLFPITSALNDLRANFVETGVQGLTGLAGDLVHMVRGKGSLTQGGLMPSTRGMWNAMAVRRRAEAIDRGLGVTAGSEHVPGQLSPRELFGTGHQGAFTYRQGLTSAMVDSLTGIGMYPKAIVDTGFKRFAAGAVIWRDAFEAANKRGLYGVDRQNFLDNYWANLPKTAVDEAVEAANKAGYNRQLHRWEESYARSSLVKLFGEAFARYPFQFIRWTGEMLGANPKLLKKAIIDRNASPEEITRYLTRAATGIGGVYLVDYLYNNSKDGYLDYNSMEWVDQDKNRVRLGGQDYLTMPLAIAAGVKAMAAAAEGDAKGYDKEIARMTGAMRYVSIPFVKLIYGEGGMFGRLMHKQGEAFIQGKLTNDTMGQEFTSMLNRLIPGQAVMGAIKGTIDPIQREGIGANLPGVSFAKDPKIDLSTGKPLETRQKYLGMEFQQISGTPIPGATRLLEPVAKLLSRYGGMEYRGPRTSIAGYPAGEEPDNVTREWKLEFGQARSRILGQLIPSIEANETRQTREALQPGSPFYEQTRKMIQKYDAMAAKHATDVVNARALKAGRRRERKTTVQELRRMQ
jgi:transposase-like protein